MRLKGSILIVVLGLLAVLAVVGIAFVTMSSIETNTASNFALQAQFDLAADGAVDYVSNALVKDVWEYGTNPAAPDTSNYRNYTGYTLTGKYGTAHWDYPVTTLSVDPKTPTQDAFLAWSADWTITPQPATTAYSFRATETGLNTATLSPYYLMTWGGGTNGGNAAWAGTGTPGSGTDGSPNNLGIPDTDNTVKWYTPQNGLWIPELASPFENGIIRVSVTVLDHAGMLNLNAHGAPLSSSGLTWPYRNGVGKGYFVSDVSPISPGGLPSFTDIAGLLYKAGTVSTYPGRWGDANGPVNTRLGELILGNPAAGATKDRPFTLDDEFELRRLTGTYAKSRLENIVGTDLDSNPDTTSSTKVKTRLGVTTVGWNAEVMPGQSGCTAKSDLNLAFDSSTDVNTVKFSSALDWGGVLSSSAYPNTFKQFNANVQAFKNRYKPSSGGNYFKQYGGAYGARRQLILSKVKASVSPPVSGKETWTIQVQVFYPWTGDYPGGPTDMDSSAYTIEINFSGKTETISTVGAGGRVPGKGVWETGVKTYIENAGMTLTNIRLKVTGGPTPCVDQITGTGGELGTIGVTPASTIKYRPFGVYQDSSTMRASDENTATAVDVVYVKSWQASTDADFSKLQGGLSAIAKGFGIPIRFPHSVPDPTSTDAANKWDPKDPTNGGPLPPYSGPSEGNAKAGIFKAFLRVGDLNQVLCPTEAAGASYWPWVPTVAAASGAMVPPTAPTLAQEETVKWRWWPDSLPAEKTAYTAVLFDSTAPAATQRQYRRYNGGNVFCVDSPWADSFDNDGDGFKDDLDTALDRDHGRFCGKEIRVAGRINLNTATDQALKALSFGVFGSATALDPIKAKRPFRSPVEILSALTSDFSDTPNPECWGPVEKREMWYTRISNIATVRSDTFSVYGTVQYVQVLAGYSLPAPTNSLANIRVVRTRRFWALIDRSPIFNSVPSSTTAFIRPRVMNFQWLD